jgi:hypothetical protein
VSTFKSTKRPYSWLIPLLALFIISAIYIYRISTTYMISDEYLVYRFTRGTLGESVQYLANRDVHPPLWFSFFWFWQRIVGQSDFVGRMQAILFSMMTLSIVYQMGRRWFGSMQYGLFAMIVLGVSSMFAFYSLEIRPYALALLLTSLSMLYFQKWLRIQTRRAGIRYALTVALLLYVHYFLFIFILLQAFFFIAQRPTRKFLKQAVEIALLVFVLWLPWFPFFITQVERIRTVELVAGSARGTGGSSATTEATSIEAVFRLVQQAANGQVALYGIALALGFFYCWRQKNYQLALVWALGVPILAFSLNFVVAVYSPRYIVNFVIGLALILAAGIDSFPRGIKWVALGFVASVSLWALPSQLPTDIIPFNILYSDLAAMFSPGDVIFLDKGGYGDDVMIWNYYRLLSQQAREDATMKIDEALPARRIWHITSEWFNKDVQANYHRIEETHPRQTGFGECDKNWCYLIQLMEAPPWVEPQVFGANMAFWGVDVDSITLDEIKTRLWWKVNKAPGMDYSMSLRLLDSNGNLVTQADGPINHYASEVVNTSELQAGRIYIDFRSIQLPSKLPAGNYKLELVVYDWQNNVRLLLPDGSDNLLLKDIEIQ